MIEFCFENVDFNGKIISTTKEEGSFFPFPPFGIKYIDDIQISNIVTGKQVHNIHIAGVSEKDKGRRIPQTDGLITCEKNLPLGLLTADCLPLFFFIEKQKIIGALQTA